MHALDDTIAAIASPPGGAAWGMVRLSGPGLRDCLERCFRPSPYVHLPSITAPTAIAGFLWLRDLVSPLPCDLYLWPARRSYTGQSVAELHTLGSPPLLEMVLRAVCAGGARLAEPGEFTLRAFLAGRIDLTQAEAVLGVIDATDTTSLHAALSQLAGGLATPLYRLRDTLLDLLAHLEAGFDFADEDLPFIAEEQLSLQLDKVTREVNRLIERMASRADSAESIRVVLLGRPNTGKSSLFNALAQSAGALVSDQPGTTRDYLTAQLNLDGVKCQLVDTAGMESVPDSHATIAHAAQMASIEQRRQAHVELLCIDATRPPDPWEQDELSQADDRRRIVVLTKVDGSGQAQTAHRLPSVGGDSVGDSTAAGLPSVGGDSVGDSTAAGYPLPTPVFPATLSSPQTSFPSQSPTESPPTVRRFVHEGNVVETSSVTGQGLRKLRMAIREAVLNATGPRGDVVAGTAVRCADSLRAAAECLDRGQRLIQQAGGEELIASEIRNALTEIGKVAGAVYTEDVLERIFSRFCVGK